MRELLDRVDLAHFLKRHPITVTRGLSGFCTPEWLAVVPPSIRLGVMRDTRRWLARELVADGDYELADYLPDTMDVNGVLDYFGFPPYGQVTWVLIGWVVKHFGKGPEYQLEDLRRWVAEQRWGDPLRWRDVAYRPLLP